MDLCLNSVQYCLYDEFIVSSVFWTTWLLNLAEDLIAKVVQNLSRELDAFSRRKWDFIFVNQFLRDVREAKKRGRKEKRHKEAQAILAAAAAAVAASSRNSTVRKDANDDVVPAKQEVYCCTLIGQLTNSYSCIGYVSYFFCTCRILQNLALDLQTLASGLLHYYDSRICQSHPTTKFHKIITAALFICQIIPKKMHYTVMYACEVRLCWTGYLSAPDARCLFVFYWILKSYGTPLCY